MGQDCVLKAVTIALQSWPPPWSVAAYAAVQRNAAGLIPWADRAAKQPSEDIVVDESVNSW